jgi:ParB-like nuclease domain
MEPYLLLHFSSRRYKCGLALTTPRLRAHSDEQVDQIARSIEEFGFTVPVLCDPDGGIIAGHGRVLAAKQLGLAAIPVMIANGCEARPAPPRRPRNPDPHLGRRGVHASQTGQRPNHLLKYS